MSAWERESGELPVPNLPPFGRKAGRGLFVFLDGIFGHEVQGKSCYNRSLLMKKEEIRDEGGELLRYLCGARLSSVQFVLDYLILGFDEKGALTTLVWPEIISGGTTVTFGTPGYRDRLCDFIPKVVENAELDSNETIVIVFEDKSRMTIPLRKCQSTGERAILTTPKNDLFVW
jgi:hypothetical protein